MNQEQFPIPKWDGAKNIYDYFNTVLTKIYHKQYAEEMACSKAIQSKPQPIQQTAQQKEIIAALKEGNRQKLTSMYISYHYGCKSSSKDWLVR